MQHAGAKPHRPLHAVNPSAGPCLPVPEAACVLRSALWAKIHRPAVTAQHSVAPEPPSSFDIAAGISSPRPYDRRALG